MLKVVNPALGWCHVAAGTFALRLARNSTSTPTNKRTHNKKDIDSEVYLLTIEAHHESISFLFVLLITTSLSAGVLHVPACNHDRPPKSGIYFLCTCAVYRITFLTGCAYRHTRSRPVVGEDDLLYRRAVGDNE